jgi:hypothetical protein
MGRQTVIHGRIFSSRERPETATAGIGHSETYSMLLGQPDLYRTEIAAIRDRFRHHAADDQTTTHRSLNFVVEYRHRP